MTFRRQVDDATDLHALLVAVAAILVVFGVGAAVQTAYVFSAGPFGVGGAVPRLAANLVGVAGMLAAIAALRVHEERSQWRMLARALAAAVLGAGARSLAQRAVGIYDADSPLQAVSIEFFSALGAAAVAGAMGVAFMMSRRRLRMQAQVSADGRIQIELALAALQNEEVRVRREVAEGLHGSLQQRLVLIVARLDIIQGHLAQGATSDADVEALQDIRAQLEQIREGDVREASRMLYPDGLEVGMVPAMRSLLGRIPASIGTRLQVSPEVRALDDPAAPALTQTERLLAVRVVEEALTNALRHGGAGTLQVRVDLDGAALVVEVEDDGAGFDAADAGPASGTARLRDRLALVGGDLTLTSSRSRGATLRARVPIARAAAKA
ncbi:ATP-binding protein [Cellulomonas cellasea]|uniref:sensor histidine kinase n=1 Tax=Cellulomonas cellasea TaxID=43670 RepID=UPI0025A470F6|nr:ATP-binding protein [Cellulomonas cellasea]MDM8083442.1 ATP-binding protein [Cellulomonas cellasea]